MEPLRLKPKSIQDYLRKGGSISTIAGILGVSDKRTMNSYIEKNSIVLTCESVLQEIQMKLNVSRSDILEEKYPEPLNRSRKQ